jgi:hypothetical protein
MRKLLSLYRARVDASLDRQVAVTALSGSTVTEVNGPTCRHAGAL